MQRNEKIFLIGTVLVTAFVFSYSVLYRDVRKKALLDFVFERWGKDIHDAASFYNIPERRIASIIATESAGDHTAVGRAGEIGLMQIMPGAYSEFKTVYAKDFSFGFTWNSPLEDGRTNIFVGTGYLRILLDRWGSLDSATMSYNSGTVFDDDAGKNYLERVKSYERQYI